MEIYWDDDNQLTPEQSSLLTKVAEAVIKYCNAPDNSEVSISFMGADEIQALNRDYRGKDTPTDVLSFPVNNTLAMGQGYPLGDVVICMEVAKNQAEEYGHSLERELAFLTAHGMLHLQGYDHEIPEDEAKMRTAQDEILHHIGIKR